MIQVEAIRVDDTNRKEANQQILALSSDFPMHPLNEGIFLAQLSLRAELLNHAFQNAVAGLITAHASTDQAIAAAAAASCTWPEPSFERRSQERRTPVLKGWRQEDSSFSKLGPINHMNFSTDGCNVTSVDLAPILFECQFSHDIDVVEIHPAPIKSLRRMQEKLSEYLLPSQNTSRRC